MELLDTLDGPLPPVLTQIIWDYIPSYRWYLTQKLRPPRSPLTKKNSTSKQELTRHLETFLIDGQTEATEFLMGTYPNATPDGLFHWATLEGHMGVVKYLLATAPPKNIPTGLFNAACGNHLTLVDLLLSLEMNECPVSFEGAIIGAAHGGHFDLLRSLVPSLATGNIPFGTLDRALKAAAAQGHTTSIKYLLKHGATQLNAALGAAVNNNRKKTALYLISKGATRIEGHLKKLKNNDTNEAWKVALSALKKVGR